MRKLPLLKARAMLAKKYAELVIVIDDESADRTVKVAKATGAEVILHLAKKIKV